MKMQWTQPAYVMGSAPLQPCPRCGALSPCCDAALTRGETAASLARLVDRQQEVIAELRYALEARG